MSAVATVLKRLSITVLSAGLMLVGAPLLGSSPALAATPAGPAKISLPGLASQTLVWFGAQNDGTNTTNTLLADTTVPGPGYPAVATVSFFDQDTDVRFNPGSTRAPLGTATSQPWTIQFATPWYAYLSTSPQLIWAVAYDAQGTVIDSALVGSMFNGGAAVAITGPGATTIAPNASGNFTVSGTRSASNPALYAQFWLRDNATGLEGPMSVTQTNTARGGWSFTSQGLVCPNTAPSGCDLLFQVIARDSTLPASFTWGPSDQHQWQIRAYVPTATSMTVTPSRVTVLAGTPVTYLATVLDQNGAPLAGGITTIDLAGDQNDTAVAVPSTPGVTNHDGQYTVTVTDPGAETNTVTISAGDPTDTSTSISTVATQVSVWPTPASVAAVPSLALYATADPDTPPLAPALAGSEYTASSPAVQGCFTLPDGSPIDSSQPGAAASVFVTRTRSTTTAGILATADPVPVTLTQIQGARPGCFGFSHPAAGAEDQGSDTFSGYVNRDGVPGYQEGTDDPADQTSDIALTDLTLTWGQLTISSSAVAVAVKGAPATVTFTSATPNGQPFAGRTLALDVTSSPTAVLTATQPAGTTVVGPTSATCVTDPAGRCSAMLTDPNASTSTVTATDRAPAGNQHPTGSSGTATVVFSPAALGLNRLAPAGSAVLQPSVNTSANRLRPGDIGRYGFTLLDANQVPLVNSPVTLSIGNGFFTPVCATFAACTFSTARVNGQAVGTPASLGNTLTVTSDASARISFAVAIGRDAGLDATGSLPVVLTASSGGGQVRLPLAPFTTTVAALTNGGSVSLVAATGNDQISGAVQASGTNQLSNQAGLLTTTGTNLAVRLTDQFGNLASLVNCSIPLVLTGTGYLTTSTIRTAYACGSYTGTPNPETFHLDSDAVSVAGATSTVTATWNAPVTVWRGSTGTTPGSTGSTVSRSGSVSILLYAVDQRTLTTTVGVTPISPSVPVRTAVRLWARVVDTKNNPMVGVAVSFASPSALTTSAPTATTTTTDAQGIAFFPFTCLTPAAVTVTASVLNSSNAGISSGRTVVTFTGTTPAVSPSPTPTPSAIPTTIATPTPTSTPTPTPSGQTQGLTPPTISGPPSSTVTRNQIGLISGTATPGGVVYLHFHRAGTAVGDYGIVRRVTADAAGNWSRSYLASTDYRVFVSQTDQDTPVGKATHLLQVR